MLHLGSVAQTLGRNADGIDQKMLNKVMAGCICITAIAGAAQVFIALRESLNKKCPKFDRDECSRRSR